MTSSELGKVNTADLVRSEMLELVIKDSTFMKGERTMAKPGAQELNIPQLSNFKMTKSGKDANGIFKVVEYRRVGDNMLYLQSTLSNPDAKGNYQTDTRVYYKADGTTVDKTITVTITYDTNGDLLSEVPNA